MSETAQPMEPELSVRRWPWMITLVAALLSLFQLWQPLAGFLPPGALPFEAALGMQPAVYFRPVHFFPEGQMLDEMVLDGSPRQNSGLK